jgi:hypothetical protein
VAPPPPPMQIQQVARAQEPPRPAAPRRVTRDTRAQPERAPRLSFDPLAAPDPEPPPPERPTRAPRFAAARPPDAMPRLDAPALRATPAAPAPSLRSERSKPAPDRSRRATAQLALAASAPALPSDRRPTQRESRRAPALPAPRRSSRSQVALDVPDSGSSTPKRPRPPAPPPPPLPQAESGGRGARSDSLREPDRPIPLRRDEERERLPDGDRACEAAQARRSLCGADSRARLLVTTEAIGQGPTGQANGIGSIRERFESVGSALGA